MPTSGDKPNFEKTPTKQFIFRQSQAKKDQFFSRLNEVTGWIKAPKFSSKGFWFGFLSSDVKLICWANDSFFNVLFGDLSDEGILDLRLFWWLEKLKHITKWWYNADEFHGRICKIITWKQTQGIGIRITTKKVDLSNHKHTKIRNGGILYVFLATIHFIHSYSKYATSCKYLGLPNPANSGTLGTPAKTTMEPDNGHIGRRDFPLGSIISWVSSKLSGSTIGPSAIAWTSFGYCSLGFGLREQLRMETSNKNSWRVGFRGDFTRGSRISCSINGCFVVGLPLQTNIEWEGLKANYIGTGC